MAPCEGHAAASKKGCLGKDLGHPLLPVSVHLGAHLTQPFRFPCPRNPCRGRRAARDTMEVDTDPKTRIRDFVIVDYVYPG